jgi:hypothetical protein
MTVINRDHLIKYLGIGYKPGDVAKIFNVSPAYVSQLLHEEGVVEEIQAARAKHNQAGMSIDENYTQIELAATGKILERVNQGFYKPTELVAVAVMANKATRKVGPQLDNSENGGNVASIRITLPTGMVGIEILRTPDNQVLKVGDVSLQPLSKQVVHEMAEATIAIPKALPKPEKHFEV